ncbi:glycoside hydrolase family 9 protein [Flavisolibacter tropicus]|uniref:glycoside hydrolase family 9 protein n=1 Tax=Flavisolibacter tropicus TaxID=1492898 RepID=UPI00082E9311|nr:glycoside hydrolase family 9 protein [Flavisolibacter tropicus]
MKQFNPRTLTTTTYFLSQALKQMLVFMLLFATSFYLKAAPAQTTYHIKVDQFGYLTASKKVAVIVDPQVGYNAAESFLPGTGTNQYQVRRWSDDVVVFAGTLQAWGSGTTHTQSGDKGWWFDFTSVTTPGSYYVYDVANNIGSFRFEIGDNVYDEVLKQAMRVFFYQRINFAKQAPYTDTKWADGAAFEGANQDRFATSRFAKGNMSTAKDVHGGWMDAGDMNKYTTFANSAVIQLMEAYRINPAVFKDNYNIPESGNGIPDILDEVKWELDFLKRMQDAAGTNGFLLKVGVDNYNEVTPPSTDTRPRYYLPECTAATLSGCSMFAVSGMAMKNVAALSTYAQDLIARAELAWARAKVTTNNFTSWQTACDDGDIKSGDADNTAEQQLDNAFVAAVYLYEATGKAEYKTFAETNYTNVNPYKIYWWGPYWMPQQLALLRLTTLPNVSSTVINNILNQKAGMDYLYSVQNYTAATDLYRAHMGDDTYHWGHNQVRTNAGIMNLDYITFGLNTTKHQQYKEVAEQYLHWMHGVNPMGMVMLSNMYAYGAEKSVNEIYHAWFTNGSKWDNALTSPNGPAPGYVPGGPNKQYSGPVAGITDQPHQKAYKDWNTAYPENSWEITEPAIYSQASYIMLLARLLSPTTTPPPPADTIAPAEPTNVMVTSTTDKTATLSWTAASDNVGVTGYDVYQGATLLQANVTSTTTTINNLNCATAYGFSVKAKDAAGNLSAFSNIATATTQACIVVASPIIYDDAIGVDWSDVSTGSTRNFNATNIIKVGSKSIKVDYAASGLLAFQKGTAVTSSSTTQLKFWIYNASKNGIRIYTESTTGAKSADVYLKTASNKWEEVVVSMSQLGNPATIKKVVIGNNSKQTGTMYFDQIQLTSTAATARAVESNTNETAPSPTPWTVYPNPAKDQVVIQLQTSSASWRLLFISDNTGKVVYKQRVHLLEGANKWLQALPKLTPGIYTISINDGQTLYTKAIVIQ